MSVIAETVVRVRAETSGVAQQASKDGALAGRHFSESFQKSSRGAFTGFNRETTQATRGALAGSGAFKEFGRAVAFASTTFLGTAGLVAGIKASISAASNLNEQTSKARATFGESSAQIEAWSKTTADAFGLASDQSLEFASTFGALLRPMGVAQDEAAATSQKMVELGADLASFYNTSVDDALMALKSGVVGESEPLRRFGILLSENRVQAQALSMGLVHAKVDLDKVKFANEGVAIAQAKYNEALQKFGPGSVQAAQAHRTLESAQNALSKALAGGNVKLTDQQKVLARTALIFHDSALAQGDFHRTSEGLANMQRRLSANIRETEISIGKALMPTVINVTRRMNEWFKSSDNQARVSNIVKGAVKTLSGVIQAATPVVQGMVDVVSAAVDAVGGLKTALEILLALKIASWASGMTKGFAAVGGDAAAGTGAAGAAGKVGGLTSKLGKLKDIAAAGAITVGITLLFDSKGDQSVKGIVERALGIGLTVGGLTRSPTLGVAAAAGFGAFLGGKAAAQAVFGKGFDPKTQDASGLVSVKPGSPILAPEAGLLRNVTPNGSAGGIDLYQIEFVGGSSAALYTVYNVVNPSHVGKKTKGERLGFAPAGGKLKVRYDHPDEARLPVTTAAPSTPGNMAGASAPAIGATMTGGVVGASGGFTGTAGLAVGLGGASAPLERAGGHTKPIVVAMARRIAFIYGATLTLGAGTQHNQFVSGTNNTVQSDHWVGNAVDIPMIGANLVRLGRAALIACGADPMWAMKQGGGAFKVKGWQVIFNVVLRQGGNHKNHLHLGWQGGSIPALTGDAGTTTASPDSSGATQKSGAGAAPAVAAAAAAGSSAVGVPFTGGGIGATGAQFPTSGATRAGAGKATYNYEACKQLWTGAGGPESVADIAAAIAYAENGGIPKSWSISPTHDFGVWQINRQHGFDEAKLLAPDQRYNAQAAVHIYNGAGGSFTPWTTYRNKAYLSYLKGNKSGKGAGAGAGAGSTPATPTGIEALPHGAQLADQLRGLERARTTAGAVGPSAELKAVDDLIAFHEKLLEKARAAKPKSAAAKKAIHDLIQDELDIITELKAGRSGLIKQSLADVKTAGTHENLVEQYVRTLFAGTSGGPMAREAARAAAEKMTNEAVKGATQALVSGRQKVKDAIRSAQSLLSSDVTPAIDILLGLDPKTAIETTNRFGQTVNVTVAQVLSKAQAIRRQIEAASAANDVPGLNKAISSWQQLWEQITSIISAGGAAARSAAQEAAQGAVVASQAAFSGLQGILDTAFDRVTAQGIASIQASFESQIQAVQAAAQAQIASIQANAQAHIERLQRQTEDRLKKMQAQLKQQLDGLERERQRQTIAEKRLTDFQARRTGVTDARSLTDAEQAIAQARIGGDPEEIKQAQRQLDDFLFEQQQAQLQRSAEASRTAEDESVQRRSEILQKQEQDEEERLQRRLQAQIEEINKETEARIAAINEQTAAQVAALQAQEAAAVQEYQDERDAAKETFDAELADWEKILEEHPEKWNEFMDWLNKQDPYMAAIGGKLGKAFASHVQTELERLKGTIDNLKRQLDSLRNAADAAADAIRNIPGTPDFVGGCFTAGTPVATPDGDRPIEQIKVGDLVYTWDFTLNEEVASTVVETFIHEDNPTLILYSDFGSVRTTAEHRFWSAGRGWVPAGKLLQGDNLTGRHGKRHVMVGSSTGRTATVYNLHVDHPEHNYFANGILVHNVKPSGAILGGTVAPLRMRMGGLVPGNFMGRDSVPLLAAPGETVIDRRLTQAMARYFLGGGAGSQDEEDFKQMLRVMRELLGENRKHTDLLSQPAVVIKPGRTSNDAAFEASR